MKQISSDGACTGSGFAHVVALLLAFRLPQQRIKDRGHRRRGSGLQYFPSRQIPHHHPFRADNFLSYAYGLRCFSHAWQHLEVSFALTTISDVSSRVEAHLVPVAIRSNQRPLGCVVRKRRHLGSHGPDTGFEEIKCDFLQADFWPVSVVVRPGWGFSGASTPSPESKARACIYLAWRA